MQSSLAPLPPSPDASIETPPAPEQKNWFNRNADATWETLQAPARWLAPQPAPPEPAPILYDPPEALIVPRSAIPLTPHHQPPGPTTQP